MISVQELLLISLVKVMAMKTIKIKQMQNLMKLSIKVWKKTKTMVIRTHSKVLEENPNPVCNENGEFEDNEENIVYNNDMVDNNANSGGEEETNAPIRKVDHFGAAITTENLQNEKQMNEYGAVINSKTDIRNQAIQQNAERKLAKWFKITMNLKKRKRLI